MGKLSIAEVAILCHEANRAYCEAIGDHSQPSFYKAPDWRMNSAKDGVLYHLMNPASQPRDSHGNWMKTKIAEGWVYGEEKNPVAKTHHCLVPFEQLPQAQQAKDYIFHSIVKTLQILGKIQSVVKS